MIHSKLNPDLVCYYPMDEASGSVVGNYGSGGNGSIVGSLARVKLTNGKRALLFDNSILNYVDITDASLTNFADYNINTGFTILAWVQTSSTDYETFVNMAEDSGGEGWAMCILRMYPDGKLLFGYRTDNHVELGSGIFDSITSINDGKPHLVGIQRAGNTFNILIDNHIDKTGTQAGFNTLTSTRQNIGVGGTVGSDYHPVNGISTDVMFISEAISLAQFKAIYKQTYRR